MKPKEKTYTVVLVGKGTGDKAEMRISSPGITWKVKEIKSGS